MESGIFCFGDLYVTRSDSISRWQSVKLMGWEGHYEESLDFKVFHPNDGRISRSSGLLKR